jgi:hypothetical protein
VMTMSAVVGVLSSATSMSNMQNVKRKAARFQKGRAEGLGVWVS